MEDDADRERAYSIKIIESSVAMVEKAESDWSSREDLKSAFPTHSHTAKTRTAEMKAKIRKKAEEKSGPQISK